MKGRQGLRYLTSGDSHGKALSAIVEGFPSGVFIDEEYINRALSRRQTGYGRGKRMEIESDKVEFLSGIRKGKTTGAPISFLIKNNDWINWKDRIDDEKDIVNPRPGHADLSGLLKYRLKSIRDVIERSSARETAVRVSIGALSKIVLDLFDIEITSFVYSIGKVKMGIDDDILVKGEKSKDIEKSVVRCPDKKITKKMVEEIDNCINKGDSLGGGFYVIAKGVLPGLGSYSSVDSRLDARLAKAIISIPAVKSFGLGVGSQSSGYFGTEYHDEIYYSKETSFYRKTNRAGGIEGGITNGMPIVINAEMKPIPTTLKGLNTVDLKTRKNTLSLKERSDYCAVPAASVVGEFMVAIELMNAMQEKFGKDNIEEMLENYSNYKKYLNNY